MGLCLKLTAGLLLLVQAFHLAALQYSTDSPGRTIDQSWLRGQAKNSAGSQNAAVTADETEYDQAADATAMESSNDYSGIASGSMAAQTEEEANVENSDTAQLDTSDNLSAVTITAPPTFSNVSTKQPELPDATVSPADSKNSSQINLTEAKEESDNSTTTFQNSTTHLSAQNSTSFPDYSNHTDSQETTSAAETNVTQESTTKPDEDAGLTNGTESTNATTVTTTTMPEINETSTTPPSTTAFLSETTERSPATIAPAAPSTPEKANKTEKASASGGSAERGLESDHQKSNRNGAWGAVLGTAVAVGCVGLVAFIILKKKHQKGFSHRKLVEEYPSDPVLRLDNNEPLDLNFGRSAYYNPALQGDNIQMTNIPGRR
ncbi:mucin-15 [Pempheris klunzingeri]|uniref:mucin-15 n=1 Tax=Pempheris klunzingeri TaxID=3127111 RepID=UPI00397ED878